MWKWLVVCAILITAVLIPTSALAGTTADVTITATGIVVGAPGGLTLTYISDYEVGISWTKGTDAENTMIRAAYGRTPGSRTDGYLVYYGPGDGQEEIISDTGVSLDETATPVYYRAWSQNASGGWENEGVSGFIEGIGVTTIAFIILALGVVGIAMWKKHLLLYLVAFIGLILIASHLIDTSLMLGIPLYLLSGYMMWEFVTYWF